VVLKGGRIVEQGSHEQLLAMNGEYAKLHRIQFSEPDAAARAGERAADAPAPVPPPADDDGGSQ